tara:strand:- start:3050 stop:3496 length:447 start_codon:yes stop_codon:yes gene_type:complete
MKVEYCLEVLRQSPVPLQNMEIYNILKKGGYKGTKWEVRDFLWTQFNNEVKYRKKPYYDYQIVELISIPSNVEMEIVEQNNPYLPMLWVKFDSREIKLKGYLNTSKINSGREDKIKLINALMKLKLQYTGNDEIDDIILDLVKLYERA